MNENATGARSKGEARPLPGRYSAAFLASIVAAIPLLALVIALLAINNPVFEKYFDSSSISTLQFLFHASNQPCQILMYGDSTAMTGLDPDLIGKLTGMHACNIAVPRPVLEAMGDGWPLDKFLARNPKPKYLVIQDTAADLHEQKPGRDKLENFEGVIVSLRQANWRYNLELFRHNPDYFFGVMNYVYRSGPKNAFNRLRKPAPSTGQSDSYVVFPTPPLKSCVFYDGQPDMPDVAWIESVRKRYVSAADNVIVDVSPTSPCAPFYSQWKNALGGATDNSMELYPNNLFVDGKFHLSREGAIRRSNELAEQILAMEQKPDTSAVSAKILHQ